MKLITWNVNGIRAVAQKGLLEFWEKEKPDFLCLQETKAHPDQLEESLAAPRGWQGFWSAAQRPGYSGTVTFCRETPLEVKRGFGIPKFDAEGRMVVTRFPKFTLFNVYFPNGNMSPERHLFKQEFLRRFGDHLVRRAKAGENIIVVGDYNVGYLDIDVYDPVKLSNASGFLPEEREWMRQWLKSGFIDGFRHFHPDEKHRYTWWAYVENARVGNRGWRIDHISVSRSLEKKLKSVEILESQMGSDHCPVVAELNSVRSVLIAAIAVLSLQAEAGEPVCAKSYVTLRKGPGANEGVSWKVARYMPFLKVDYKGSWSKLEDLDGETHWGKTADFTNKYRCVVVKTNIASLKEKPDPASPTAEMRTADRYTPFKRLENDRDWMQVEDEAGRKSWVHESQVWKPVMIQSISF